MNSSRRSRLPPLNIALVTYSSGWGGAELHTLHLATTLTKRGHTVTIVELNQPVYSTRLDLAAYGLSHSTKLDRSDVTVLIKGGLGDGSLLFDLNARRRSRVYVTIEHSMPPLPRRLPEPRQPGDPKRYPLTRQRWWMLRQLEMKLARSRAWVGSMNICVSDAIRINLETAYGFPAQKLRVVRNGVDAGRFVPSTARRDAARSVWRIAESSIVIGTVGRLEAIKGVDDALDYVARVISEQPELDIRFVIVGDGNERVRLTEQTVRLGIESKVVFAGTTEQPEMVYPGFDIFALPSRSEGLPFSLLEAMSTELVPVCTAVGGIPEVITGQRLGWTVEPGNRDAFHAALAEAIRMSPADRMAMGARCRARVINSFDANKAMEKLVEIIEASAS